MYLATIREKYCNLRIVAFVIKILQKNNEIVCYLLVDT